MNHIFRTLLLALIMTTMCANAYAQRDSKQRMTREQLAQKQAKYIANEMAMDDETSEKFITTFCQFQKEIWALGPRPRKKGHAPSNVETEQTIADRFAHSQKILDIRKKYYKEYSKFLTQKQIERIYELEHKMMERLSRRKRK